MNCAERVAGDVNGETVVAAGRRSVGGEDFLDWQRDWLADNC